MELTEKNDCVEIAFDDDFDAEKIFECGQCFRWNADGDGSYVGVAGGKAARVSASDGVIRISGTAEDFESVWRTYFDLDRSYAVIRGAVSIDGYMREAADYGAGIRILRQEPWEALCSFILSQCSNIPRIKTNVERLCSLFGGETELEGRIYSTFPGAAKLARLEEADLAPLRCGYRAPYIIAAARAVDSGTLDLDALAKGDADTARRALKSIRGVGDKVADCVLLFGLGMDDAVPRDVWIKRAVAERYGKGFDPAVFGGFAGVAQQYMFYHGRSLGTKAPVKRQKHGKV